MSNDKSFACSVTMVTELLIFFWEAHIQYPNTFKLKYAILFFRHHTALFGIGEYQKSTCNLSEEMESVHR